MRLLIVPGWTAGRLKTWRATLQSTVEDTMPSFLRLEEESRNLSVSPYLMRRTNPGNLITCPVAVCGLCDVSMKKNHGDCGSLFGRSYSEVVCGCMPMHSISLDL